MKKLFIFIVLCLILSAVFADDVPVAGRLWLYGNVSLGLSKSVSWLTIAGTRYEFSRAKTEEQAKEFYFNEFFTGPMYLTKVAGFKVILPVLYYYMGFPMKSLDKYTYSHNIEFSPVLIYRFKKFVVYNRFIFHNTIYSTFYEEVMNKSGGNKGYSLLLRWKIMGQYLINEKLTFEAAVEPFIGLIEDDKMPAVTGPGFSEKGLDMNRVYAGFVYKLTKNLSVEANYVYETSFKKNEQDEKELSQIAHYIFITLKSGFKLY